MPPPNAHVHGSIVRRWLAANWFLIGLGLAMLFAWCWPAVGLKHGPLHPEWSLHMAVGASFFISGLTLPLRQLAAAIAQVRLHLFIQGFSFVLIPLVVVAASPALAWLDMSAAARLGLLVLACLPTTIASAAILTRSAGGNEAAALCNTSLGNILGVVATPALLLLFAGRTAALPIGEVLVQLAEEVLAPIAVGQAVQLLSGGLSPAVRACLRPLPNACIVFIVFCVFSTTFAGEGRIGGGAIASVIAAVVGLHALLLGLCWWLSGLARFSRADRVCALYCATQKTMALGAPLIAILFQLSPEQGLLSLPIVLYHPVQLLVGGALAPRLKAWVERSST